MPGKDDPRIAGPGTNTCTPLKRVEHIVALKPDTATLSTSTPCGLARRGDQHAGQRHDHGKRDPQRPVASGTGSIRLGDIQLVDALLGNGETQASTAVPDRDGRAYGFISTL